MLLTRNKFAFVLQVSTSTFIYSITILLCFFVCAQDQRKSYDSDTIIEISLYLKVCGNDCSCLTIAIRFEPYYIVNHITLDSGTVVFS